MSVAVLLVGDQWGSVVVAIQRNEETDQQKSIVLIACQTRCCRRNLTSGLSESVVGIDT